MKEKINTKQMAVIRRLYKEKKFLCKLCEEWSKKAAISVQKIWDLQHLNETNKEINEVNIISLENENKQLNQDIRKMREEWTAERAGFKRKRYFWLVGCVVGWLACLMVIIIAIMELSK